MPSTKVIEVLYCCSDSEQDEDMRQKLEKHLSILRLQGVISNWYPGMISAGKEWESEIDKHMKTADIILVLISSELISSPYHWDVMVQQAMEQRKAAKAHFIPVFLHKVDNRYVNSRMLLVTESANQDFFTQRLILPPPEFRSLLFFFQSIRRSRERLRYQGVSLYDRLSCPR